MDGLKAGQGKAFHSHYAKMDELNKELTFAAERYCSIDLEEIDIKDFLKYLFKKGYVITRAKN